MANISDAYGTINITADKGVVEKLAYLIKATQDGADYGTCIDYDTENDIETYKTDEGDYSFGFSGSGRWTYEMNIEYMYNWIKNSVYNDDNKEYYERNDVDVVELRNIFKDIENSDWKIVFDYRDAEGGCKVLYERTCVLAHLAGSDSATLHVMSHNEFEYTAENLRKMDFEYLAEDLEEEEE